MRFQTMLLAFLFPAALLAAPVRLRLTDGSVVTAETGEINLAGAWYKNSAGVRTFVPRKEIAWFVFSAKAAPSASPQNGPSPTASAQAAKSQNSASSLAEQLNSPSARAQFALLRDQLIGGQGGDNTDEAKKAADEMYEEIASGHVSEEQLMAKARQTLTAVDGMQQERTETPQFETIIATLRQIVGQANVPATQP